MSLAHVENTLSGVLKLFVLSLVLDVLVVVDFDSEGLFVVDEASVLAVIFEIIESIICHIALSDGIVWFVVALWSDVEFVVVVVS
jgi:hypothetical protein